MDPSSRMFFLLCALNIIWKVTSNSTTPNYAVTAVSKERQNKLEARQFCLDQNKTLPVITNLTSAEKVVKNLRKSGLSETWTEIEKKSDMTWIWLDGTASKAAPPGGSEEKQCSSLRVRYNRDIYATRCSSSALGIICQYTDCQGCSPPSCHMVTNHRTCIKIIPTKSTWYTSLTVCEQSGGELLPRDVNIENFNISEQGDFWIGLVKGGWKFSFLGNEWKPLLWGRALDELQDGGDSNCATLTVTSSSWTLKPAHCEGEEDFICIGDKEGGSRILDLALLGFAGGGVVLTLTVLCAVNVMCVRCCRKTHTTKGPVTVDNLAPNPMQCTGQVHEDTELARFSTLPSQRCMTLPLNIENRKGFSMEHLDMKTREPVNDERYQIPRTDPFFGTWSGNPYRSLPRYGCNDDAFTTPEMSRNAFTTPNRGRLNKSQSQGRRSAPLHQKLKELKEETLYHAKNDYMVMDSEGDRDVYENV